MLSRKKLLFLFITSLNIIKAHNFNIIPIKDLLKTRPDIECITCQKQNDFDYKPLPISNFLELAPHKGTLAESFILKIPNGMVFGTGDYIVANNSIIEETAPPFFNRHHQKKINKLCSYNDKKIKIKGKVATLSVHFYTMYGHWLYNCLGRLALLEAYNIDYDYIYIPYDKKYIKETLVLWGIDENKIIIQKDIYEWMQADELIVTSFIGNRIPNNSQLILPCIPIDIYCKKWATDIFTIPFNYYDTEDKELFSKIDLSNAFIKWTPLCAFYPDKFVINYLHKKFTNLVSKNSESKFSKKIFISRKDTSYRLCLNEDEIFSIFQKYGYERYLLSELSMLENIELFYNAESVASLSGSGLTQILFCKPNTKIIEIFMDFAESCFCYLSQEMNLQYYPLKTKEFSHFGFGNNTIINPKIISNFLEKTEL